MLPEGICAPKIVPFVVVKLYGVSETIIRSLST